MIKEIHDCGDLFKDVQLRNVLGDGKTFPDCIPLRSLNDITADYHKEKSSPDFDLKKFVEKNFTLPKARSTAYQSDPTKPASEHIAGLWDVLTRLPDEAGGSMIPLPHPYVVPGGRFGEIYYWDSYFTMLGLDVSGRHDMIRDMILNFSHLIDTIGYIPNGNRTYFIGRSQPPFFSLMIRLLNTFDASALSQHLPQLEREHHFWMRGSEFLFEKVTALDRVARMPGREILNRYWDENTTPRPESYKEDVELAQHAAHPPEILFRHLRAAAESGWDFSSRWFSDPGSFASIHTTDIIPVDLNCLLVHLEQTLSDAYRDAGNHTMAEQMAARATDRIAAVNTYCWSETNQFYFDFDFVVQLQLSSYTLAACFPLFFNLASSAQASAVAKMLQEKFLKPGGLTTTLVHSSQQWDAPNGWAPLQWIAYKGLLNYGFDELAGQVKSNWLAVNDAVYKRTGKMTEKYDVWSSEGEARGGEYPNQDGFGWTNGVYLAMTKNS